MRYAICGIVIFNDCISFTDMRTNALNDDDNDDDDDESS
jgi:hypothetical protein